MGIYALHTAKRPLRTLLAMTMVFSLLSMTACVSVNNNADAAVVSADDAITDVTTIGFVDTDGAKLSAIIVAYNVDLTGAKVDEHTYDIYDYGLDLTPEIGENPGVITKVYVNDTPSISSGGGTGSGRYVIIEVNTNYQLGGVAKSYKMAMAAHVTQTAAITADNVTVTPGTKEVGNYTVTEVITMNPGTGLPRDPVYYNYADEGTYAILGTDAFELHTLDGLTGYKAFHATACFDEANGEYWDFDLPYALYVPEDYDAAKEYALVLSIHDAGFMGVDPMITLTEAQGPVNFASPAVQDLVKKDGLGGIIVVAPQVAEDFYMDEDNPHYNLRATRDDYSLSAVIPATWQLMDAITETYNIDMNRIYGTGQSMGGMQAVAMAAQRDNYFAGLWANGCQWGSNFNLADPTYNNGVSYFEAPADGDIIWTKDADGNACNYRNWYYMVSDDNILITNCKGDSFSTSVWKELKYLYYDLAGVEIPYVEWNPLTTAKADQSALLNELIEDSQTDRGFYWFAFDGGNHMATWIYSHGVFAAYEWLLSQDRQTEMERGKLPLDKPFEKAEIQIEEPDRAIAGGTFFLLTGKPGAGTDGYNSALYGRGGNNLTQEPGWQ